MQFKRTQSNSGETNRLNIRGVHFHDMKVKYYLGALHSRSRKLNIRIKIAKLRLMVIFMFPILQVKRRYNFHDKLPTNLD